MLLAYNRVSTQEQAADGTTSLDEQARACQGFAMMKGVAAFNLQVFTDAGISGAMALNLRPAGHELLQAAKAGDTIVATKLDRMFRDSVDALNCFEKFKKLGIDLVLLQFGTDPITDDKNIMGKVMYTIMAAFADWDRMNIAIRMQEGKAGKKRRGGHAGGEAPYGYRIVGAKRQSRLEMAPEEQEIIGVVRALENKPIYKIACELNKRGCKTRSGKPWHYAQVERIKARLKHESSAATH